ncbi:MAG: hypothetical protein AAF651_10155 [Cyanobacteria bacterium P01_C01_bin.73]
MGKPQKSDKVPAAMEQKFNQIMAIADDFSQQHLNEEYAQLICWQKPGLWMWSK